MGGKRSRGRSAASRSQAQERAERGVPGLTHQLVPGIVRMHAIGEKGRGVVGIGRNGVFMSISRMCFPAAALWLTRAGIAAL